ncbi:MAG: aldo/keto reductase [Pseudomonadota bacterium]
MIPWSPLGGGLLTGKVRRNQPLPNGSRAAMNPAFAELDERTLDTIEAVVAIAEEIGKTASQVALAWTMQQPGVTSPIFGARTMEQLEDNLGAVEVEFDPAQLERLDTASALKEVYPYGNRARARQILEAMNFEFRD